MKCALCGRSAVRDGYCTFHSAAYEIVTEEHARWKKALEVSWKEYLSKIAKNPLTGEWAREVAQHLIETERK